MATQPDIRLAGLALWIHGRQFPEANDYWDGNWLLVTARCSAPGARVSTRGPFLHLSELAHFVKSTERIYNELRGEAVLQCMEPTLYIQLIADVRGHISMRVCLTPEHLSQEHAFTFEFDQSYLTAFLSQCRRILNEYPVKQNMLQTQPFGA